MKTQQTRENRILEFMLIILVLGISALFFRLNMHRMVVLNLFFLPIVLCGYYLGRFCAGVLALLCVLVVTIVTMTDTIALAAFTSPIAICMALAIWGAALGLTAILVGTLCDERTASLNELREAYVGVVEVLSKYLQCGNNMAKAQSIRIAELSQMVAEKMNLSRKEIDDIRVAVLLCDLGNVEVTTRLIRKAMNTLESNPKALDKRTFLGTELVQSIGSVIHTLVPLLANQYEDMRDVFGLEGLEDVLNPKSLPISVQIIQAVKAYDALTGKESGDKTFTPEKAFKELREDTGNGYNRNVLNTLEHIVGRSTAVAELEPVSI